MIEIQTNSTWSMTAGKYQTWHTVRAEHHKWHGYTDLTTPSFYTDEEKPTLSRRKFLAYQIDAPKDAKPEYFWVTPRSITHIGSGITRLY